MVSAVLSLIRGAETVSPHEIAERLGTSSEEISAVLDFLFHAGYLERINSSCGKRCAGCRFGKNTPGNGCTLWKLEKTDRQNTPKTPKRED
jgi:predicted ArsR family transcriptional regulator